MFRSSAIPEITVRELKDLMDRGETPVIVDVRSKEEFAVANIDGTLIRLDTLPARIDELAPHKNELVVVHCRSGARSANAVQFMMANGFTNVRNLKGGMIAWSREIDPSMPSY